MPTTDERREVAENLRTMTMRGCRYKEEFYDLLNETVMNEWDFHSFSDVAERLADLIEPEERTCRMTEKGLCSECGEYIVRSYTQACGLDGQPLKLNLRSWNYCHGCGAKVVSECE